MGRTLLSFLRNANFENLFKKRLRIIEQRRSWKRKRYIFLNFWSLLLGVWKNFFQRLDSLFFPSWPFLILTQKIENWYVVMYTNALTFLPHYSSVRGVPTPSVKFNQKWFEKSQLWLNRFRYTLGGKGSISWLRLFTCNYLYKLNCLILFRLHWWEV